ncbi:MAG: zinc-binding dehydrogenase [Phycisphaerae bacterium]
MQPSIGRRCLVSPPPPLALAASICPTYHLARLVRLRIVQAIRLDIRPINWLACKAGGRLWPGIYFSRLSGLRLVDVPVPALPGAGWVRLRTILGGICGTDLALIRLRQHPGSMLRCFLQFPVILGHENVAIIDEVGPAAAQAGWSHGQRVCVEPTLACQARGIEPPCPACAAGRFNLCRRFADGDLPVGMMIGLCGFTSGSWAQYFLAHHSQLHPVPKTISDQQAVLTDPLACAVHAVLRRAPKPSERVLVLGGGIIGLGTIAALRALAKPASLTAVVRYHHQAELARRLGADTVIRWHGSDSAATRYRKLAQAASATCLPGAFGNQFVLGGFDLVYDCLGTGASLTDAMKWARPAGTVVELGTTPTIRLEATPLWFSELTLVGCNGRQIESYAARRMHTYRVVFELISSGRLQTAGLLTHTFALHDYRRAFAALADRARSGLIKAAFAPAQP